MKDPELSYSELLTAITGLRQQFLEPLLAKAEALSDTEVVTLKAYIVLAHAAFEDYFESLSRYALQKTVDDWEQRQTPRPGIATLLLHCGKVLAIDDDTNDSRSFDRIRLALKAAKSSMSISGINENHGISIRHLRKLFYPVGVDLPPIPEISSASTLFDARCEVAHHATWAAKKQKDPGSVRQLVEDCLKVAEEMKSRVIAL